MISCLYIEEDILTNPKVQSLRERFVHLPMITCQHYKDVFNPGHQRFQIQKKAPALILAQQTGRRVLESPEGFGIGGSQNYYFSHMLNCVYDCRYCFLQGMYPSAHYVYFINETDFKKDIADIASRLNEPAYFFSGYDCDSLAMDPVTGFVDDYLPFFKEIPNAILELRTKSTQIKSLLNYNPIHNCVIAFSFTPKEISQQVEHKVPLFEKRIAAMKKLASLGWKVGLRLDPLIYGFDFEALYTQLIEHLFVDFPIEQLHSVSIGPMRFPEKMYKKIVTMYPEDKLLAHPLEKRGKIVSYKESIEQHMRSFVRNILMRYVPTTLLFECHEL